MSRPSRGRNGTLRRLLTLGRYLEGRTRMPSYAELAQTFGVHIRTVSRDLDTLEEVRWPIPPRPPQGPSRRAE